MELKAAKTPGRNDPFPCKSGKKYKNCHAKLRDQLIKNTNKRREKYLEEVREMKCERSDKLNVLKIIREVKERSGFWGRRCPVMTTAIIECAIMFYPSDSRQLFLGSQRYQWAMQQVIKTNMIDSERVGFRCRLFMWFALARLTRAMIEWSMDHPDNLPRLHSAQITLLNQERT